MRSGLAAVGCPLAGALAFLAVPTAAAAQASSLPKPPMSVTAKSSYTYGARVHLTVTLKAEQSGAEVKLYATPAGGQPKLVASGTVNAKGKLAATYRLTANTKFTAVFAGDADDAAAKASRKVEARAAVTDSITGYFKTVKISGTTYRLFHAKSTLTLHATVAPNAQGQCLEPETEQYDQGVGWDADTKYGCDALSAASHDTAPFTLGQAVGDKYRMRADYTHAKKDAAIHSADGAWVYFEVVK
jgi:hypothetical protein